MCFFLPKFSSGATAAKLARPNTKWFFTAIHYSSGKSVSTIYVRITPHITLARLFGADGLCAEWGVAVFCNIHDRSAARNTEKLRAE